MRKVLVIGLLLTAVIYILPVFCGLLEQEEPLSIPQESVAADAEITESPPAEGEQTVTGESIVANGEITVLVDGEARTMKLEDYVTSVVAGEISPDFPTEAIRAQAVAARTYALYKQKTGRPAQHEEADVCDDPAHCAAFVDLKTEAAARWGEQADTAQDVIRQAVEDTAGQVLTYEGEPIVAVFSSAAGEKTERAVDVWGSDIPYLQSVDSPGGEACPKYYDAVVLTADEIRARAEKTLPSADLSGDPSGWFKASERSKAGGIVRMKFGGVEVKGTVMRTLLGLNSTNFTVKIDGNTLTFTTTGYGHGVGLSQWGAKYSAEQGQTYDEILAHYYPGTTLTTISTE
ncbi:MAG: stage II sporulation protein D [Butyricicoccus pullicaecorum]|nr:stage II sporulation protein D [Butyricicoccus pullicaecorum]